MGSWPGRCCALAVLHVLAALYHHFMRKDDVLRRMLPFTLLAGAALILGSAVDSRAAERREAGARRARQRSGRRIRQRARWSSCSCRPGQDHGQVRALHRRRGFLAGQSRKQAASMSPIDMGSADTRDKERDDTLRMADLFNTAKFPRATYVATAVHGERRRVRRQGQACRLRGVSLVFRSVSPLRRAPKPASPWPRSRARQP